MSNCKRCGATPQEIAKARREGNAVFYIPCGCDFHGDHAACELQCDNFGCDVPVGVESECDHNRVRADNPNLVVNHITNSLRLNSLEPVSTQAAGILIDLDKAGYKIVKK